MTWQAFITEYGWRARRDHLAAILQQPATTIDRVRQAGCKRLPAPKKFGELFAIWHGRPPREEEWPKPMKIGGGYEWLAPELQLLARLVGRMDKATIARALTTRLRQVTGDATATRDLNAVQNHINDIGLQIGTDLVGGLTTAEAAKRVGRLAVVNQAIANGKLRTFRVGKRHVIPRSEFDRWMATRQEPPTGYVRLASLQAPLGISSDSKLPEYAALRYIPTAVLVAGIGTARGVWYLAPDVAQQILDAARAGRKLPWHGKPIPSNQQAMWHKWQARKHRRCRRCAEIWRGRAPKTFEAFCARYHELSLGEKRHVTIDKSIRRRGSDGWRPRGSVAGRMRRAGLTVAAAAAQLQQPTKWVRGWIRRGLLDPAGVVRDPLGGEAVRITDVGMAVLRGLAAGEQAKRAGVWVGVHEAAQIAGVCITTAHRWREREEVLTRPGGRGVEFEVASLKDRARRYWAWAVKRYHRAEPPAWLRPSEAA